MGDAPFHLKFALKVTHHLSKNADFNRFPLLMFQRAIDGVRMLP